MAVKQMLSSQQRSHLHLSFHFVVCYGVVHRGDPWRGHHEAVQSFLLLWTYVRKGERKEKQDVSV